MRLQRSTGLVGHWKFNEKSGITANDSSRYRNTGTLTGASHLPIWSDKGIKFDGVDDYVDAGNNASFTNLNQITISAWINPKSLHNGSNSKMFIGKFQADSDFYIGSTYLADTININFNTNNGNFNYNSNTPLLMNTWYLISVVYNGSTISIYRNGIIDITPQPMTGIVNALYKLYIGKITDGNLYNWDGSIDEVRIYNRALSASEIKQYYDSTKHNYI